MKKTFFLLICFLSTTFAQKYEITGSILDRETNKPLGYASIRIDETTNGTTTNVDGLFILKLNAGSYKLIFSYVGYKTDTISVSLPGTKNININLQPEVLKFGEVVVYANDNIAYRVIREAIKRKKENRKGLVNFEYNAYAKKIIKSSGEVAAIEETFIKGYNKVGSWEKEFILSTHKTENQKKETHSMDFNISDSYYIDFSKDTLTLILNKIYLPLADNAFDYYDYKLVDISESESGDVYRIKVIPRSSIQPLLKGEITIESGMYAVNSVNLEINEGVRFPFVNDLSVKFVQQFGKYNGYWFPNYIETKSGFEFSFQGLLALDKMQWEEVSNITEYKINSSIPDSIEHAVNSKYGGFTADTSGKGAKPYELSREEIKALQPIPLTKSETEAYATLDSTKTLEKIIKIKGALSSLIPDEDGDTTKSILSSVSGFVFNHITLGNNRVTGILLGPKINTSFFQKILSIDLFGGYTFRRKKVEGKLSLRFEPKDFYISAFEVNVFNKSKQLDEYTPYPDILNGIAVTLGFNDHFNYFLAQGISLGMTKNFSKGFSAKFDFVSEKESSLPAMKYQSIFKANRIPEENPNIVEGSDRKVSLEVLLGKDPMEIQFIPENGIRAKVDLSNPKFASDFNYKRFRVTGLFKTKTIYKELFIAPYLEMIVDAGIVTGKYGPQHLFNPNTALDFFSPPGAFKGLKPYYYTGSEMAALHVEHNWRSIPFQALGLNFISNLYLDFITGGSVLKTWNRSGYLPGGSMNKPYWEMYAGISRIFGLIRIDVSYNAFKDISVTSAIGVVL
ncbi:MAG: DUF5686 family protein [Ignavibacteriaceae bacterium]